MFLRVAFIKRLEIIRTVSLFIQWGWNIVHIRVKVFFDCAVFILLRLRNLLIVVIRVLKPYSR